MRLNDARLLFIVPSLSNPPGTAPDVQVWLGPGAAFA